VACVQCLKCNLQAGCCSLGLPSLALSSDSEPQRWWGRSSVLFRSGFSGLNYKEQARGPGEKETQLGRLRGRSTNLVGSGGSIIIRQSTARNAQGLHVCTLGILADLTMVMG
jgi:hypothetical protein